jgi:hypothetical protein
MKNPLRWNRDAAVVGALGLAFVIGLWFRCYLLTSQVFADDEWHGFYYAIGKSPGWLLTHFSIPGATCIPLNFYTWLLGQSVGWSEWLLRLPSLICGVLFVLIGPWLAWRFAGPRRAVLLAFLLAICPLLIFYSRICRPYSAVAFLAFSAVLLAAHWMEKGGLRFALLFIGASVLAIYFHLFAIVTVAAPIMTAFGLHLWRHCHGVSRPASTSPGFVQWLFAAVTIAIVCSILILPAMIHSLHGTFFTVALKGSFRLQAFPQMALLISGSGQPVVAALFWLTVIAGMVGQCRRNPWLGWTLVSLFPLHAVALILSRPDSAQSAIVLTRYCIPLVPVCLFFAAAGIQSVLEAIATRTTLQPILQTTIAALWVMALGITGPLPQCYVPPNNFTNHGAYQHRYGIIDWRRSFYSDLTPDNYTLDTVIKVSEVPPFYQTLSEHPGDRPVVEYPMPIGDHFNPLYYYQHFDHRPVMVGYTTDMEMTHGLAAGNIYGNTYVDQVLSQLPDQSRLHFRNMISMDDLAGMRRRRVEYIIIHKRFESQLYLAVLPLTSLPELGKLYLQKLGQPVYEDNDIAVFKL